MTILFFHGVRSLQAGYRFNKRVHGQAYQKVENGSDWWVIAVSTYYSPLPRFSLITFSLKFRLVLVCRGNRYNEWSASFKEETRHSYEEQQYENGDSDIWESGSWVGVFKGLKQLIIMGVSVSKFLLILAAAPGLSS